MAKERWFNIMTIKGIERVRGALVPIKKGVKSFVHRCHDNGALWSVTELTTGTSIAKGDTPQQAIDQAHIRLFTLPQEGIECTINKTLQKHCKGVPVNG